MRVLYVVFLLVSLGRSELMEWNLKSQVSSLKFQICEREKKKRKKKRDSRAYLVK